MRTSRLRTALATLFIFGLVAAALAAAGCGGTTASPSPSASSAAGGGALALKALALKTYVSQLKPIYDQVATSVGSLDGAVSGLSKRPDKTWATSATKLNTAAAGLGTAATDLAALTPPPALQSAQSSLVAALQQAQKVLETTGAYLAKGAYLPTFPEIKTQIQSQVNDALKAAWAGILDSVNKEAAPAPTATP